MTNQLLLAMALVTLGAASSEAEFSFRVHEIETGLGVGYATRILDLNGDQRPDILVVDTDRVVWYENPSWQKHVLIQGQTKPDNVCVAPYDIDGDGKVDLVLGADWRPFDTNTGGTIQWLARGASPSDRWSVHPVGTEPTVHRMQWADLDGDGKSELIVVPLMGRGTTKPKFAERPLRILAYKIPADPVRGPWEPQVLNEELYVAHNFAPTDLDRDGKTDILVASFEGVNWLARKETGKWTCTRLGAGNQENQRTPPNRGASEIKHGRLAGGGDYIATIEPWHGFQVVIYTPPALPTDKPGAAPATDRLWDRHVLDEQLQWGHAVWCANLDEDADEELIIGVRDDYAGEELHKCGLRIYDPTGYRSAGNWPSRRIDPGGVAIEDLAAADLNADGRIDIVAVGRKTKNVRIYWNEAKSP